jgi:hypothetical protein
VIKNGVLIRVAKFRLDREARPPATALSISLTGSDRPQPAGRPGEPWRELGVKRWLERRNRAFLGAVEEPRPSVSELAGRYGVSLLGFARSG